MVVQRSVPGLGLMRAGSSIPRPPPPTPSATAATEADRRMRSFRRWPLLWVDADAAAPGTGGATAVTATTAIATAAAANPAGRRRRHRRRRVVVTVSIVLVVYVRCCFLLAVRSRMKCGVLVLLPKPPPRLVERLLWPSGRFEARFGWDGETGRSNESY